MLLQEGESQQIAPFNTPPIAAAGTDQTVEATGTAGASVTLNGAGSSDLDGDALTMNWTGPFGSASGTNPVVDLPIGTHTVTLTVSDGKAPATDTVVITVRDTTPPVLALPPDVVVTAAGLLTPVAIGSATATDIFGATVSHDAPASFPIGTTLVTWTAVDGNGNSASAVQKIEVIYGFGGFAGPIQPGGTYRANRTLPLMFTLSFADGTPATAAVAALGVAPIGPDSTLGDPLDISANGVADAGNVFRFVGDHYQFNLSSLGWSPGAYRFTVTLDDGRSYSMDVKLR
jgi:hypothetical protein